MCFVPIKGWSKDVKRNKTLKLLPREGGIIESLRGGENQVNFIVKQPNFPPHPRGLNNDRSLFKVTKRESSWEVDEDDLKSFCMVTIPCIQKR